MARPGPAGPYRPGPGAAIESAESLPPGCPKPGGAPTGLPTGNPPSPPTRSPLDVQYGVTRCRPDSAVRVGPAPPQTRAKAAVPPPGAKPGGIVSASSPGSPRAGPSRIRTPRPRPPPPPPPPPPYRLQVGALVRAPPARSHAPRSRPTRATAGGPIKLTGPARTKGMARTRGRGVETRAPGRSRLGKAFPGLLPSESARETGSGRPTARSRLGRGAGARHRPHCTVPMPSSAPRRGNPHPPPLARRATQPAPPLRGGGPLAVRVTQPGPPWREPQL